MSSSGNAPVVGHAEQVIAAAPELVWSILADFAGWPRWNRSVTRMAFTGPLAVGTTFRWTGGGSRITSTIEEVVPHERLAWSGRTLGIRAYHSWELVAEPDGTRVVTEESFHGPLARLMPGYLGKVLVKALQEGLEALKSESERLQARPSP